MSKPAKLYATPTHEGPPLTIGQIAALAGCSYVNAFERVQAGKPVGGHVWARTGASQWTPARPGTPPHKQAARQGVPADFVDAPHGRPRKLMESDDFPGRLFTQDEVRQMGKIKADCPLQPYVRKGYRIGGHVWRFAGTDGTGSPGEDNVEAVPVRLAWRKNGEPAAPVPAPAPESPRRWVYGSDPEAYDVFPLREARPVLDSGAERGRA